MGVSIGLCIIIWLFKIEGLARLLATYNVFYMAGYLFYKQMRMKNVAIAGGCLLVALIFICINKSFHLAPMQMHKEHADYVFVLFGIFSLTALSLLFGKIKIAPSKWLDKWNERGYTIYLYQNFVFFAFFPIYLKWIQKWDSSLLQIAVCGISIFLLSTLLSSVTYRLDKYIIGRL